MGDLHFEELRQWRLEDHWSKSWGHNLSLASLATPSASRLSSQDIQHQDKWSKPSFRRWNSFMKGWILQFPLVILFSKVMIISWQSLFKCTHDLDEAWKLSIYLSLGPWQWQQPQPQWSSCGSPENCSPSKRYYSCLLWSRPFQNEGIHYPRHHPH